MARQASVKDIASVFLEVILEQRYKTSGPKHMEVCMRARQIAVTLFFFVSFPSLATCWLAPNGQVFQTASNSSPPVAGARQIACPGTSNQPSCPANAVFDGRGCRCNQGFSLNGSSCVQTTVTSQPNCPANSAFDGKGCRCNSGYQSSGQGCVRAATTVPSPTNSGDVCQPYYGRGYCTDYITQRMGSHPRGVGPSVWPANRNVRQAQAGVALIFGNLAPPAGHVAYVERVVRQSNGDPVSFEISEMNYGGGAKSGVPRECWVSNNFGVVTRRTISVNDSSITGFWSQ